MRRSSEALWFAGLFAVVVLASSQAIAQTEVVGATESGSASLLFQFNRSATAPVVLTGPIYTVAVPEVPRANLRFQATQFLPNFGRLEGLVDLANSNASFVPQRGRVAFTEVQVGSWTAAGTMGDIPFDVYPIDFGVAALYRPLTGLRGAKAAATRGAARLTVFGGRTTTVSGFFGESALVSDQSVYGARTTVRFSRVLEIGVGLLHSSATETLAVTTGPTNSLTLSTVYEATPTLRLFGEASMARLVADPQTPRQTAWDASYIMGSRVRSQHARAEFTVTRLGPGYAPLAYTNISDRRGLFGYGDFRVHPRVWVNGVLNRWHNNVRGDSTRPSFDADNVQVGARVQLAGNLFLNTRAGEATAVTRREALEPVESRVRTFSADLSRLFGRWRILGRATGVSTSSGFAPGSQRSRVDVEVRRGWPGGTNAWTTVGLIREHLDGRATTQSSLASAAGFDWSARSNLSLYAEASLNQELIVANTPTVRNVAVNSGVRWSLPRGFTLGLQGRYSRDTSDLELLGFPTAPGDVDELGRYLLERSIDGYQFNVRIQKTLAWGNRPLVTGPDGGRLPVRDFGHVAGIVFSDVNSDGVRSVPELGVANVSVKLDGTIVTEVDEAGRFEFRDIPVGRHTVELDLRSVPATYDVGPGWRTVVEVFRRETTIPQFPLVLLGRVRGRVLVTDGSGAPGGTGSSPSALGPAPNILVSLNRGKTTLTDADGEFEFTSLPAGHYQVRIGTESLPDFWVVVSEPTEPVLLEPGGRISGLELRVETRPRPRRRVILQQPAPLPNAGSRDQP